MVRKAKLKNPGVYVLYGNFRDVMGRLDLDLGRLGGRVLCMESDRMLWFPLKVPIQVKNEIFC